MPFGHFGDGAKRAPHKAGTELFPSRLDSQAVQKNAIATSTWSVRTDVTPPTGPKAPASYKNTNPDAFATFMRDHSAVERSHSQAELTPHSRATRHDQGGTQRV